MASLQCAGAGSRGSQFTGGGESRQPETKSPVLPASPDANQPFGLAQATPHSTSSSPKPGLEDDNSQALSSFTGLLSLPNQPSSPSSRKSALRTHVQKRQLNPKAFVGLLKLVQMLSIFPSFSFLLIVFLVTKEACAYCKNIHAH